MKDNKFSLNSQDECQCIEQCTCGKASEIFNSYAKDYFLPTEKFPIYTDKETKDNKYDDDEMLEFEELLDEIEFIEDDTEKEVFQLTPHQIEQRKSSLKETNYFNNQFVLLQCYIVEVEVAFRNAVKEDIVKYVNYATEGTYELVELRDHFVKFITHYDPKYYTEDDTMNLLHDVFGNERDSIVITTYL